MYLEFPAVGRKLAAAEACAVVESVKAASDVYAPIAGEVVAVNDGRDERARAGESGSVRGLAFRMKPADAGAAAKLLDARAYEATIGDA